MKAIPISAAKSLRPNPMNINWNELEAEDLPPDLEEIASDLGIEVARYLVETWGGATVYIPTLSRLRRQRRDRLLRQYYDGSNEGELARQFGISRRHVKNLLRKLLDGDSHRP